APVGNRQKDETEPRRNVIFAGEIVVVVTHTVFKCQVLIEGPFVLEVGKHLCLVAIEFATALVVQLLAACSIGPQDPYLVAAIAAVEGEVIDSTADLHKVRAGEITRTETEGFQCLVTLGAAVLLVEEITRVLVRREVHWGRT